MAEKCPHCGLFHQTTCPRIAAIEYAPDGTVKRIEFHRSSGLEGVRPPSAGVNESAAVLEGQPK